MTAPEPLLERLRRERMDQGLPATIGTEPTRLLAVLISAATRTIPATRTGTAEAPPRATHLDASKGRRNG